MRDITKLKFYKKWVSSFLVNMLRVHYDFYKLWIKEKWSRPLYQKIRFSFFFLNEKNPFVD